MEDTDTKVSLMEVEDRDIERESLLIWKTPLDNVPDLPYLRKEIFPWTKKPPKLPKDHYTKFGEKILNLVKDRLLTLWILDRTALYAILGDHFYPREMNTQSGRATLAYEIANNPEELEWAAAWLIYKRAGGLLDLRETEEFGIEIEENLPEAYQQLQEVEMDKQYLFTSGQICMKRRIAQISQDQSELLKWIGMDHKRGDALTSSLKALNAKLMEIKKWVDNFKNQKPAINEGDKKLNINAEVKKEPAVIDATDWSSIISKVEEKMRTKLENVESRLEKNEEKLKTLVNEGEERRKKYQARKFYRIRKRKKKKNPPKPKLEDIPEEDDHSAHEEEEGYKSA